MDLPTFLVVLFLLNGEVYQEISPAPSPEACEEVVQNIKNVLPNVLKAEPKYYFVTCAKLKPFTRDT